MRKKKKERHAKKSRKGMLLIICFLCGCLYFIDKRYDQFRLRGIEVVPGGVIPEAIVWEAVPRAAERFWPILAFDAGEFTRRLENFYPVKLNIDITGWGMYRVTIEPLEVFASVSWNSRMWLLSTDNRMWLANLPANTAVRGLELPDKPILAWDRSLPLPIDPEMQGGDVYAASLAIDKIKGWYNIIERTKWYKNIYCLLAKKIDGRPVVQVLLGKENDITSEIILKDDTVHWLELAAALDEIFPNGEFMRPPGVIINATYADQKFTVMDKNAKTSAK